MRTRYLPDTVDCCFLGPFVEFFVIGHGEALTANDATFPDYITTTYYQIDLSELLGDFFVQKGIIICGQC